MDLETAMERLHAMKISTDVIRSKGIVDDLCLREQYESMVLEQTKQSQLALQENAQLRSMLNTMEKQNQGLRQTIQSMEEYRTQVEIQYEEIQRLQQEIKTLKQTNFSLQFYLQQANHTRPYDVRPPDVF